MAARIVKYIAQRDPSGRTFYLVGGIGYASLATLRAAYPGARLERIPASRRNRLYG